MTIMQKLSKYSVPMQNLNLFFTIMLKLFNVTKIYIYNLKQFIYFSDWKPAGQRCRGPSGGRNGRRAVSNRPTVNSWCNGPLASDNVVANPVGGLSNHIF